MEDFGAMMVEMAERQLTILEDRQGRVVWTSRALAGFLGTQPVGQTIKAIFGVAVADAVAGQAQPARAAINGRIFQIESNRLGRRHVARTFTQVA